MNFNISRELLSQFPYLSFKSTSTADLFSEANLHFRKPFKNAKYAKAIVRGRATFQTSFLYKKAIPCLTRNREETQRKAVVWIPASAFSGFPFSQE